MKVFIVHAHPEPKSFSAAMKAVAEDELKRQGHEVRVSDLYQMNFNPVASPADFHERANPDYCVYALEQRHAVQTGAIAPDIQEELDKLLWCDLLVLNFPIFWYSTPAILKGWIDRVFVSGIVYGGKRFYDRGGLAGKRCLVSVTLGGQEHMFAGDGIHGPLNAMLKHLLQGSLGYAGLKVYPPFIGWHVPYLSDDARRQILDAWLLKLRALEGGPFMEFPRLSDFDESLSPINLESR